MKKILAVYIGILLFSPGRAQEFDPYGDYCHALKQLLDDAKTNFSSTTGKDRWQLLTNDDYNYFEAWVKLPGFTNARILSVGKRDIFYETVFIARDSSMLVKKIDEVKAAISHCINVKLRNPKSKYDPEYYMNTGSDTIEDTYINLYTVWPEETVDTNENGQVTKKKTTGEIYFELHAGQRRKFVPVKSKNEKYNAALATQLKEIQTLLTLKPDKLKGPKIDESRWEAKKNINGAIVSYVNKSLFNKNRGEYYEAIFYEGKEKDAARKVFAAWKDKLRDNVYTDAKTKGCTKVQWMPAAYDDMVDPLEYAYIIDQTAFSCFNINDEPSMATPIFAYHLYFRHEEGVFTIVLAVGDKY